MSQPNLDKLKAWAFPGLISILGGFLWNDIKEIKSDVKALIVQTNQDKIRIDNLERMVYGGKKTASNMPSDKDQIPTSLFFMNLVAVKPEENNLIPHPETPETTAV